MNLKGFLVLCLFVAGCGIREVNLGDGTSAREIFFGPVPTVDCTADPGVSVELTTLGLWWATRDGGVGYHSGRYVCGSPACQVVIWADRDLDPERLRAAFGGLENICVIQ